MTKLFTPWEYQSIATHFMFKHKRCSLWAGMGMGKTVSAIMLIEALELAGMLPGPVLVLGPLRVARDTWPEEPKKWSQYAHWDIIPITGSPEQRKAALRTPKRPGRPQIFSCNYDQMVWLIEYLGSNWPFKVVIADEATRLKGYRIKGGGQRATALAEVAFHQVERWINLTGTPAPNGYQDLWGQQWFIDQGARLGHTHTAFAQRWFQRSWSGHGMDVLPHGQKEINEKLADCCLTLDPKDWFDLQEPRVVPIKVTLPPKAREVYKRLERELFAQLESGNEVEVFNAASLSNKCSQLANGAVYTDHPAWEAVHDGKLEALRSVVEEAAGMPILCSYAFQSDKARILEAFGKSAVDISTEKGLKAFKAGDIAIGVAHPASMGHGIDGLQNVTCKMARYGRTWNLEHEQQMVERIGPVRQKQAGFDRLVEVYDIITDDTVDEVIASRMVTKRAVQDSLLNYMKEKR